MKNFYIGHSVAKFPSGRPNHAMGKSNNAFPYNRFFSLFALLIAVLLGNAQMNAQVNLGTASTTANNLPIFSNYGYSYTQQIYLQSEISAAGNITSLTFTPTTSVATETWDAKSKDWVIYIGHTTKTAFANTTDWVPVSAMTQVFNGTVSYPAAGATPFAVTITLATPFAYNNTDNLVIAIDENTAGYTNVAWKATTYGASTNTRGMLYRSDTVNPDPAAPVAASTSTNVISDVTLGGITQTCIKPTSLATDGTALGQTTATLTWVESDSGPANGYDYYYSITNTAPTSATTPTGNAAAGSSSQVLNGLTQATTYYWWLRANCGSGDASGWATGGSFTTLCDPTNVPYVMPLTATTVPALPSCVTIENVNNDSSKWVTAAAVTGITSKVMSYSYNSTNAANDWFYTNGLNLTANVSYRVKFKYRNTSYVEKLNVAFGDAPAAVSMANITDQITTAQASATVAMEIDFVPSATGVYYVGFQCNSAANQNTLYIGDISVELTPSCDLPVTLTSSNLSQNSVTLNWGASNSDPALGYDYYVSTTNTAPVAATVPTGNVAQGVLTADVTGLTSSTLYYFWVRSSCSAADKSEWVAGTTFTTLCDAQAVPYTVAINDVTVPALPACTSIQNVNNDSSTWKTATSVTGISGKVLVYAYNSTNAANDWFFTKGLTLTAGVSYRLSFKYKDTSYIEKLLLAVGEQANADDMTTLFDYTTGTSGMVVAQTVEYTPTVTSTYYFGFQAHSIANQNSLYLGEISVIVTPTCEAPGAVTATGITLTGATLNWGASQSDPASGYEYYYSTTNTAPTAASGSVAQGVTTAALTGLTANTTYYAWVRSVCSSADQSSWTGPVTFYTGHCVPSSTSNLSYINNFVTTGGAVNISNLASGYTTGGYQNNYSTMAIQQYAGGTVNFDADIVGATVGMSIWVDWNNDLVFDNATERVFVTTSYGADQAGSFVVPAGVAVGDYRLRIRIDFNAIAPDACSNANTRTEAEDYKFTVYVQPTDAVDYANLQAFVAGTPAAAVTSIQSCQTVDVYAQAYEPGVTEAAGQGTGLVAWIGKNTNNTDPATWPESAWTQATFNVDANNNDEFKASFSNQGVGTYYYASRFQLNFGPYRYGADNNGFWDGTTHPNAVLNVVNPPQVTASASTTSICAGSTAPVTLTATSANNNYTYSWSNGAGTGTSVTVTPAASTTYTVTATDTNTGCTSTATVAVNVNPLPTQPVITTSATTICPGNIIVLDTNGGDVNGTATIGTATTKTTDTEELSAFSNRRQNLNVEMIYTAAELSAMGLGAGQISSIAFNTFSQGDAPTNTNYTVQIGTTANASFADTNFITTGLSTVFGPATYTHAIGWNTITFDTPYTWDGVSNVVILISHNGIDSINNASTYYTATTDNTVLYKFNLSGALTTGTLSKNRFNIQLTFQANTNKSWTSTGTNDLFTDAAATVPYVAGTNSVAIYAKPSANATYTFTAASATCSVSASVDITVNPETAAPTGNAVQDFNSGATLADFAVTGTNIIWYTSQVGGTVLPATTPLTEGTTYYASQTVSGCESPSRLAVTAGVDLNVTTPDLAKLRFYPNPVTDILNITSPKSIDSVSVFNMIGQVVYQAKTSGNNVTTDLSSLPTGTYIVTVTSAGLTKDFKIMKR